MNKFLTHDQQEIIADALIVAEAQFESALEIAERENKQILVVHYKERLTKVENARTLFFQFRTGTLVKC